MNYKNWIWKILKYLSNLTISIILLLIIASLSIIGTIIEQDNTIEYYQTKYPIHAYKVIDFNWQTIKALQLDQIYTNIFFLAIIFLFGLSLIVCTFSTQLPSLKQARRWKFKKVIPQQQQLHTQPYNKRKTSSHLIYHLNNISYYVFYKNNYIYAYKGLYGRLAPVFVHLGLILLLSGTCISLFTSFSLQTMIPVGETFALQNIIKAGIFSKIPTELVGKVKEFNIEYYENTSIKQFYSLVIIENKKNHILKERLLSVNNPLYFNSLTIYQTDWQLNGLRLEIDYQQNIQVPLIKFTTNNNTYWISTFKYNNDNLFSLLLSNLNGTILCYDAQGNLINSLKVGESQIINHIPIKITNILASTGLQIKQDPGVNTIYLGFAILMFSTVTSYTSYSQIWIIFKNNEIKISGVTNRAEIKFEEDIFTLKKLLVK